MTKEVLCDQAVELEMLLRTLMRRLFTLEPDPAATRLPLVQLRALSILQAGPCTVTALSIELGITTAATTQVADRLQRSGLAERVAGVEDRRIRYLQLTTQGSHMMAARRQAQLERMEAALLPLPPTQREAVLQAVKVLAQSAPPAHSIGSGVADVPLKEVHPAS